MLLSKDKSASITEAYSIYLKHTEKLYCVDVDEPEIRNMKDFIAKTGIQIFKNCCWIQGNTKGIHIYSKINNMVDNKDQQNVYKDFCGDLIQKNSMWEKKDKKIQNYKGVLQEFEYEDIKEIFNKKNNDPEPEPELEPKQELKSELESEQELKSETENNFKNLSNLAKLEKMLPLYSATRIQELTFQTFCFNFILQTFR